MRRAAGFVALALALALGGCGEDKAGGTSSGAAVAEPRAPTVAAGGQDAAAAAPAPAPVDAAPALDPAVDGADFTAQAQLLYRIAACGAPDDPVPDGFDPTIVARHCKKIRAQMDAYRERYVVGARPFFDALVPDDAPDVVVYPFGGGDLISALVAFPDATEITTISLELAGDPRRITTLDASRLEDSLAALRVEIGGTLQVGSNTSENLSASQANDLPAQVSSFLMGLAANGFEPVGMRYFRLAPDGAIDYLDADEIAAIETAAAGKKPSRAKRRKGSWTSPNFSEAFAHVEIRYRKAGDPSAPVRVHRHLGWNLGDEALAAEPALLRHLEAKGKVTILTKGASYLLWSSSFATIRGYVLDHLAWMLSDSTGVPPAFASKAGMVQETYGTYTGAFLPHALGTKHDRDFIALWANNPKRKLGFRFGYIDAGKHAHLVVTRPK